MATAVKARPIPEARAPWAKIEKPAENAGVAAKKSARATRIPVDRTGPRLVTFPPARWHPRSVRTLFWRAGQVNIGRTSEYNRPTVTRESESPTREGLGTPPSTNQEPAHSSGSILGGRYRVEQVLGFGGMGVVYRARDLKLDQEIALKRIRPDRFSPERRETLRREIILARKVTHENVCRVFDLVEIGGEEFVSMEYLPGRTLKDIEQKEKILPLGRGLAIAKGICNGLAAAHRIGVLHRDLKPENVMVGDDGKPQLMDFGIAVETGGFVPNGETIPGTPQFLAPELLQGESPSHPDGRLCDGSRPLRDVHRPGADRRREHCATGARGSSGRRRPPWRACGRTSPPSWRRSSTARSRRTRKRASPTPRRSPTRWWASRDRCSTAFSPRSP